MIFYFKYSLLLILFACSFTVKSARAEQSNEKISSVVLSLEDSLVAVLASNNDQKNYYQDQVKQISFYGIGSKSVVLRPYASRFLQQLSANGIRVYIVSLFSDQTVNQILDQFTVFEKGVPLKDVVSILPFNSLKETSQLEVNQTLYALSSSYDINPNLKHFNIVDTVAYYSSFEFYQKLKLDGEDSGEDRRPKPSSLKEWFLDQNKLPRIFSYLSIVMGWYKISNSVSPINIGNYLNSDDEYQSVLGIEQLSSVNSTVGYELKIPFFTSKYECIKKNKFGDNKTETVSLDRCYDYMRISFKIALPKKATSYVCEAWSREKNSKFLAVSDDLTPCFVSDEKAFFAKIQIDNSKSCKAFMRLPGRYQMINNLGSGWPSFCVDQISAVTDKHGNSYVYYATPALETTSSDDILEDFLQKQYGSKLSFQFNQKPGSIKNASDLKCIYYKPDSASPIHISKRIDMCFTEGNKVSFLFKTGLDAACSAFVRNSKFNFIELKEVDPVLCKQDISIYQNQAVGLSVVYRKSDFANVIADPLFVEKILDQYKSELSYKLSKKSNGYFCDYFHNESGVQSIFSSNELQMCLNEKNRVQMFLSDLSNPVCSAYQKVSDFNYQFIKKVSDENCKSGEFILTHPSTQLTFIIKIDANLKSLTPDMIFEKVISSNAKFVGKLKLSNVATQAYTCVYSELANNQSLTYSTDNLDGCLTKYNNIKFLYKEIGSNPTCYAFIKIKVDEYKPVIEVGLERCSDQNAMAVYDPDRRSFLFLSDFAKNRNLPDAQLLDKARRNLIRSSSYLGLISNSTLSSTLVNDIGEICVKAINDVISDGGSLGSTVLINAMYPLSKVEFGSGVKDNTFYHYTNNSGLPNLFKLYDNKIDHTKYVNENNLFEQIFYYLRGAQGKAQSFWYSVFYVAEDPNSSSGFGSISLEFSLDMETPSTIKNDLSLWKRAVDEVVSKYPKLKSNCTTELNRDFSNPNIFGKVRYSDLFYIIAESSGVMVIDYDQRRQWFQILNPDIFKSVKLYK